MADKISDLAYQYHSIEFDDINTWDDWRLIPAKRPWVNPPEVKTNYMTIPGANGYLDFTEALSGTLNFGSRDGEWEFYVDNGYESWSSKYSRILNFLHGQQRTVRLLDDPLYSYEGRFEVSWDSSDNSYSKVKIKYKLGSLKHPTDSVGSRDWQWDELFSNTIFYGTFNVSGQKQRNLLNQSGASMTLHADCSSEMYVYFEALQDGITLPAGSSDILTLAAGNNPVRFEGYGRVKLTYGLKDIL